MSAHRRRVRGSASGNGYDPDANSKLKLALTAPRFELGGVFRRYAKDLIGSARRCGFGPEDAEDFTMEFFLRLEERDSLQTFDRRKGEFRSFLLTLFQRFLANQWHSLHAIRRGGAATTVSFDGPESIDGESADWRTPEVLAELHWSHLVVEHALEALRQDLARQGKARAFDVLLPHLLHESNGATCARSARRLGLSGAAARMTLSRYRCRLRGLIRRELQNQGCTEQEVQQEMGHLLELSCL